MKKTSLFKTLVVVLMGGVVAASCNEKENDVQKNLPEIADIQTAPGAEGTVEFYAYDSWTITSDKEWCTFDPQSGDKGDNTVAYSIADDFAAAESATITLSIGSDNVSFRISRTEKARTFSITDAAGAAVSALAFGEDAKSHTVKVSGNFEWELPVDQFPGWLTAPAAAVSGVLNSESGLYEASLTLAVNESEISNYYESKTATMTFEALDDLNWSADLALSHTFEKPAAPAGVLSSTLGTTITIDVDGNIKGANGKTLDFTLTAPEGETGFKAYPIAIVNGSEYYPCVVKGQFSSYEQEAWVSMSCTEGNVYTLTINKYPAAYDYNGTTMVTEKAWIFVLPSSVTSGWSSAPFPGATLEPDLPWWWNWATNKEALVDTSNYPYYTVLEPIQKYVITINVEQPE